MVRPEWPRLPVTLSYSGTKGPLGFLAKVGNDAAGAMNRRETPQPTAGACGVLVNLRNYGLPTVRPSRPGRVC